MLIFIIEYLTQKDVDAFLALDQKVYNSEHQVSKEATLHRLNKNAYTDIIAKKDDALIGYISLCPIDNTLIRRIIQKCVSEEEIEQNVVSFLQPGFYDAYLSSIVVDKETFPSFPGRVFFQLLQNHIKILRKRGVFIRFIVGVAVTIAGGKTLKKMRFSEIRPSVFLFDCLTHPTLFILEKGIEKIRDTNQRLSMVFNKWRFV